MDEERDTPSFSDAAWERLVPELQRRRAERKAAVRGYEAVVAEISKVLFRLDPMNINFEINSDEYDAEAESIVPRLVGASSEADALHIVYSEFERWFTDAGPRARYVPVAREVWNVWSRHRRPGSR
jgi:hypothetical protein